MTPEEIEHLVRRTLGRTQEETVEDAQKRTIAALDQTVKDQAEIIVMLKERIAARDEVIEAQRQLIAPMLAKMGEFGARSGASA
jgi:hypothetical protein